MSVNEANIPDPDQQEAAVNDFFDSLDTDEGANESQDALEAGSDAVAEALEPTEGAEDPEDDLEEPEEAPEDEEGSADEDEDSEKEPEPDSWEKRYKDQQSFHDRQMSEMQGQLTQLQTWAQNSYQQQLAQHQQLMQAQQAPQQQANPLAGVTPETLKQGVETDLASTFRAIAEHRPDLMARTIATARGVYGDETAEQMTLEYSTYQQNLQAQAQQERWNQLEAQKAQADAPAQIEATMSQLVDDIASQYGDSFDVIKDDFISHAGETAPAFKQYMDSRGLEMTPDAINYFLQKCVNDVREQRLSVQASKPRKARKVTPKQHVEGSTSSDGNREEDMTADELAINELLEGARELSIDSSVPTR